MGEGGTGESNGPAGLGEGGAGESNGPAGLGEGGTAGMGEGGTGESNGPAGMGRGRGEREACVFSSHVSYTVRRGRQEEAMRRDGSGRQGGSLGAEYKSGRSYFFPRDAGSEDGGGRRGGSLVQITLAKIETAVPIHWCCALGYPFVCN
eukprot:359700-Chlamydomonas_euryale.AAC.4